MNEMKPIGLVHKRWFWIILMVSLFIPPLVIDRIVWHVPEYEEWARWGEDVQARISYPKATEGVFDADLSNSMDQLNTSGIADQMAFGVIDGQKLSGIFERVTGNMDPKTFRSFSWQSGRILPYLFSVDGGNDSLVDFYRHLYQDSNRRLYRYFSLEYGNIAAKGFLTLAQLHDLNEILIRSNHDDPENVDSIGIWEDLSLWSATSRDVIQKYMAQALIAARIFEGEDTPRKWVYGSSGFTGIPIFWTAPRYYAQSLERIYDSIPDGKTPWVDPLLQKWEREYSVPPIIKISVLFRNSGGRYNFGYYSNRLFATRKCMNLLASAIAQEEAKTGHLPRSLETVARKEHIIMPDPGEDLEKLADVDQEYGDRTWDKPAGRIEWKEVSMKAEYGWRFLGLDRLIRSNLKATKLASTSGTVRYRFHAGVGISSSQALELDCHALETRFPGIVTSCTVLSQKPDSISKPRDFLEEFPLVKDLLTTEAMAILRTHPPRNANGILVEATFPERVWVLESHSGISYNRMGNEATQRVVFVPGVVPRR